MNEVIIVISLADVNQLGSIRTIPGVLVARFGKCIWLKCKYDGSNIHVKLKGIPAIHMYWMDMEENLFLLDTLTPIMKLPELKWVSLIDFIKVDMPIAALPGQVKTSYKPKIIKSDTVNIGTALLTNLQSWKMYAESASATRLNLLRFAVSEEGMVLIIGNPLPSLPGQEFWNVGNIYISSGYNFEFFFVASLLQEKCNENKSLYLFYTKEGHYASINKEDFVKATRSAIRLTKVEYDE